MRQIPTSVIVGGIGTVLAKWEIGAAPDDFEDVADWAIDFWHLIEEDGENTLGLYRTMYPFRMMIAAWGGQWLKLWEHHVYPAVANSQWREAGLPAPPDAE